jgi:HSP20 family molecular chaperone IbpA
MKNLIRRERKGELDSLFGLRNWMFGWDDELLLEKSSPWVNIIRQDFRVSDDKGRFSLKAELPGYAQKDIWIEAKNGILSIEAKKEEKKELKKKGYYQYQNSFQVLQRNFTLPKEVDTKTLKTSFENGKLEINLTKK